MVGVFRPLVRWSPLGYILSPAPSNPDQYLAARLVDELEFHIVPLVSGDGARLFDGVGPDRRLAAAIYAAARVRPTVIRYSAWMRRLPSVASLRRSSIAKISARQSSHAPSAVRRSRAFSVGP